MCRDPKDPDLLLLEEDAINIVGIDWHSRLDKLFTENLGKFRKYDGRSVQDLLRALRNKVRQVRLYDRNSGIQVPTQKNHYQDLPDHVKRHLGPVPEGFLSYFTKRFPRLFLHVHSVVANTGLCNEPIFRSYFEIAE
jgi:serine/threonine-protein kinase/endoribonuclease IRE1